MAKDSLPRANERWFRFAEIRTTQKKILQSIVVIEMVEARQPETTKYIPETTRDLWKELGVITVHSSKKEKLRTAINMKKKGVGLPKNFLFFYYLATIFCPKANFYSYLRHKKRLCLLR